MQSYGPLGEPQKLVQVEPEVSPSRFLPAPAHRLVVLPSATEASPLVPPMLRPGPGSAARFIFIYTLLTCVHHRARPGASDARNQRDQGAEPLMHAPHPSAACAPAVAAARAGASRSAAVSRGRAAAALRARRVQHAPARSADAACPRQLGGHARAELPVAALAAVDGLRLPHLRVRAPAARREAAACIIARHPLRVSYAPRNPF
jgi:hypothetical protein